MRKPANLRRKLLLLCLCTLLFLFWCCLQLPCLIRHVTGLICPTCGMTRAWFSVLRLDPVSAFSLHPMFWSVPVLVLYLIYDGQLFRNRKLNRLIFGALITGLMVCYLIRLIVFLDGNLTI